MIKFRHVLAYIGLSLVSIVIGIGTAVAILKVLDIV